MFEALSKRSSKLLAPQQHATNDTNYLLALSLFIRFHQSFNHSFPMPRDCAVAIIITPFICLVKPIALKYICVTRVNRDESETFGIELSSIHWKAQVLNKHSSSSTTTTTMKITGIQANLLHNNCYENSFIFCNTQCVFSMNMYFMLIFFASNDEN